MPVSGIGIIGQFERGRVGEIVVITGTQALENEYGKGLTAETFGGMRAVLGAKWGGKLYILRVAAATAVTATKTFNASATPEVRVDAKGPGAYGNAIQVTVADGTAAGKKYTVKDTGTGMVEVFDNRSNLAVLPDGTKALPGTDDSILVNFVSLATDQEPDNIADSPLATGAEGTIADSDYTATATGIPLFEATAAKDVALLLTDDLVGLTVADINAQMQTTAENSRRLIAIVSANSDSQLASAAVTDVANYRSLYMGYAWNYGRVRLSGISGELSVPPQVGAAANISKVPVHHDPTTDDGAVGTARFTSIVLDPTVGDLKTLRDAGVLYLENDRVLGIHTAASMLTSADTSRNEVRYRRTVNFIAFSLAEFLRRFQGKPRSKIRRRRAKSAAEDFLGGLSDNGSNVDPIIEQGGFSVRDEGIASPQDSARGLWVLDIQAITLPTFRHMVARVEVGTGVVISVL